MEHENQQGKDSNESENQRIEEGLHTLLGAFFHSSENQGDLWVGCADEGPLVFEDFINGKRSGLGRMIFVMGGDNDSRGGETAEYIGEWKYNLRHG